MNHNFLDLLVLIRNFLLQRYANPNLMGVYFRLLNLRKSLYILLFHFYLLCNRNLFLFLCLGFVLFHSLIRIFLGLLFFLSRNLRFLFLIKVLFFFFFFLFFYFFFLVFLLLLLLFFSSSSFIILFSFFLFNPFLKPKISLISFKFFPRYLL